MGRTVRIIGAPMDYGANRRGVDMGPSAIRYADLAEGLERAGSKRSTTAISRCRARRNAIRTPANPLGETRNSSGKSRTSVRAWAIESRRRSRTARSPRSGWRPLGRDRVAQRLGAGYRSRRDLVRRPRGPQYARKRHPAGTSTDATGRCPRPRRVRGNRVGARGPTSGVVDRLRRPSEHRRARA